MTAQLIPMAQRFIAGKSPRTVPARKLHDFLAVGRDFSSWIRDRIKQYGFEEAVDYLLVHQNGGINGKGGDRRSKEYYLTLDMAKELAMVERNDKGREARRYFIDCEKKLQAKQAEPQPPLLFGRQRFMMTIDNGKMLPMVPIPADAYVLTLEKVPEIIRESVGVSNEDLHAIASICLDKLRYRATPR